MVYFDVMMMSSVTWFQQILLRLPGWGVQLYVGLCFTERKIV
jgi:hypothetical protein